MTTTFYVSYALLWMVVIFQMLILLAVVRDFAERARLEVLPDPLPFDDRLTGRPIPDFRTVDITGAPADRSVVDGQRTALLFISPDCPTCATTLDELQALLRKVEGQVILICKAHATECRSLAAAYGVDAKVLVDADGKLTRQFGVNGTPTAVIVSADGTVELYGHPMRGADLERLFERQDIHA